MRISALTSPEIAECGAGLLVKLEKKNQNNDVKAIVVSIGRELRAFCASKGRLLDIVKDVASWTASRRVSENLHGMDCRGSLGLSVFFIIRRS